MPSREISPPPVFSLCELIFCPDLINVNRQSLCAVIPATYNGPLEYTFYHHPPSCLGFGDGVFVCFLLFDFRVPAQIKVLHFFL